MATKNERTVAQIAVESLQETATKVVELWSCKDLDPEQHQDVRALTAKWGAGMRDLLTDLRNAVEAIEHVVKDDVYRGL